MPSNSLKPFTCKQVIHFTKFRILLILHKFEAGSIKQPEPGPRDVRKADSVLPDSGKPTLRQCVHPPAACTAHRPATLPQGRAAPPGASFLEGAAPTYLPLPNHHQLPWGPELVPRSKLPKLSCPHKAQRNWIIQTHTNRLQTSSPECLHCLLKVQCFPQNISQNAVTLTSSYSALTLPFLTLKRHGILPKLRLCFLISFL